MEKEEKELLEKLVKEVATQNKLLALLLCRKFPILGCHLLDGCLLAPV